MSRGYLPKGDLCPGGLSPGIFVQGVSLQGGFCPEVVSVQGGSMSGTPLTPVNRKTCVKAVPSRNFVYRW